MRLSHTKCDGHTVCLVRNTIKFHNTSSEYSVITVLLHTDIKLNAQDLKYPRHLRIEKIVYLSGWLINQQLANMDCRLRWYMYRSCGINTMLFLPQPCISQCQNPRITKATLTIPTLTKPTSTKPTPTAPTFNTSTGFFGLDVNMPHCLQSLQLNNGARFLINASRGTDIT